MERKKLFLGLCLLASCQMADAAVEIGKTYRIVPDGNDKKSLFVDNSSLAEKAPIVVWSETNVPAQQWEVVDAGGGNIALRNVYTGKYMDATNIALSQRSQISAWTLEAVDESNNAYLLKQGKYLRVISTVDGRQPQVSNNAQTWYFVEVEPQRTFDAKARQRMLDGFLHQYMQDKGSGYRTFVNGSWGEAETLEAILDCYEATGDRTFLNVFEACYNYMRYHVGTTWNSGTVVGGYDWFGYDFNDDVMWLIIAAARAYHLTGKLNYLNDAKRNFDLIWQRAYLGYVGLLRWAEYTGDRNGANSCINGPAEVAACYIAAGTGDESYYEKAKELYANHRKYLFVPATGQVYDSVVFDPNNVSVTSCNKWASTYNQGTMLGAAVLLYRHYGDAQYKQDADRIINYA
ncbi:MAG: RICIN domain-containing protein, partial [Prevotella sp.]|nr:RICIN domain-containing protein [Prevotella sp.]